MKRKIITILMLMAATFPFSIVYASSIPTQIPLSYTDPENDQDPPKRTPIPVLYLDGYTLTAGGYTLGSTIQLLDENDNVVFSTYVNIEGDIALPTTLSGTYTILVIREDAAFVGEITL